MAKALKSYEQFHCFDANKWYRKLEFYEQPFKDWLKWRAYHVWDMHFLKFHDFVGYFVNGWHDFKCGKDVFDCHHLSYQANQDCKCYYLSRKNRKVLFDVDITEEQGALLDKQ